MTFHSLCSSPVLSASSLISWSFIIFYVAYCPVHKADLEKVGFIGMQHLTGVSEWWMIERIPLEHSIQYETVSGVESLNDFMETDHLWNTIM